VSQLWGSLQSAQSTPAKDKEGTSLPAQPQVKGKGHEKDSSQGNSVHVEHGSKIEQQSSGDCSPNIVGGGNAVNCGPPPLKLKAALETVTSDKEGFIETLITITPNRAVSAPTGVALEFDNPTATIIYSVAGTNTTLLSGPSRNGKHAMVPVGMSFNPQHALVLTVYSELPLTLLADPHLE
jgi:hypothetical protein